MIRERLNDLERQDREAALALRSADPVIAANKLTQEHYYFVAAP